MNEQLENLKVFVKNHKTMLRANVFGSANFQELDQLGEEIELLCATKKFNVEFIEIRGTRPYQVILQKIKKPYVETFERLMLNFYNSVLLPTKEELY